MNYFDQPEAALRYAKYRPDYHELVMKQIRRFLQFKHKLPMGLDVSCGTGLSSKALTLICEKVIACDSSEAMLKFANQHEQITYVQMDENALEFPEATFDILSIASGIHWLDIQKFLHSAYRFIKPKSWLLIYDHAICTQQSNLNDWYQEFFMNSYPPPARNNMEIKNQLVNGLAFIKEEVFTHQINYQLETFVQYLCTQSNVLSLVQSGTSTFEEIEQKLREELGVFFKDDNTSIPIDFKYQYQLIRRI